MKRREFITLLVGAAAWPLTARAQQPAHIGVLVSASPPHSFAEDFRRGLHTFGYTEGKNVTIEWTRVGVLRDPTRGPGIGQFAVIQAMAPPNAVELTPIDALDPVETQIRGIADFATSPNSGLIVTVGGTAVRRDVVIAAAAKHRLPAIYPYRYYVTDGGLICYGPDTIEQFKHAADYVDRILKGVKPAELPVQAPTNYQLVINLKTAKALGLKLSDNFLTLADEIIE
jgi:putative tryptophan/tyrosine transport system substrate-binding protein